MSGAPALFGPWLAGISDAERVAQLRALRALAWVYGAFDLATALLAAERDIAALAQALCVLDRVPALKRRRILSVYAALIAPSRPERRRTAPSPA